MYPHSFQLDQEEAVAFMSERAPKMRMFWGLYAGNSYKSVKKLYDFNKIPNHQNGGVPTEGEEEHI